MSNIVSVRREKKEYDLDKIREGKVRVGFFADSRYSGDKSVAEVARYNEFGMGVPKRAFMRPAIHSRKAELISLLRSKYKQALKDNTNTMRVLESFGEYCEGLIKEQIVSGDYKPNAPSTIKKKGFNAPLRDTLLMLHSVRYEAEETKK